jgi:hypothetical protein
VGAYKYLAPYDVYDALWESTIIQQALFSPLFLGNPNANVPGEAPYPCHPARGMLRARLTSFCSYTTSQVGASMTSYCLGFKRIEVDVSLVLS